MSTLQTQQSAQGVCARELQRLERAFAEARLDYSSPVRDEARELASEAFAGFVSKDEACRAAQLAFAGRLFVHCAGDLAARPTQAEALAERLAGELGISREALSQELLSRLPESESSPAATVRTVLGTLVGLTPVRGASIWRADHAGSLRCVDDAGIGARSAAARALARRALRGDRPQPRPRAELFALQLKDGRQVIGALVARSEPRERGAAQASSRAALATLTGAIVRDALMARNASDERALVEGGERRLVRLGFDLHDGPLQELLLLGEDLRMFREQLVGVLEDDTVQALLRGRLDDLDARLAALEGGLRRISTSLHSSVGIDRPFAQALAEVLEAFTVRTGLAPELRLQGDADGISPSQRIALLSVVGEALNNVREHAGEATKVDVGIVFGTHGVSASVVDDGGGFDVERALLGAAQRGRMGLAGIYERVRLLGGHCVVDSRPGAATTVTLSLPRWEPLGATTPRRRRADRLGRTG